MEEPPKELVESLFQHSPVLILWDQELFMENALTVRILRRSQSGFSLSRRWFRLRRLLFFLLFLLSWWRLFNLGRFSRRSFLVCSLFTSLGSSCFSCGCLFFLFSFTFLLFLTLPFLF